MYFIANKYKFIIYCLANELNIFLLIFNIFISVFVKIIEIEKCDNIT